MPRYNSVFLQLPTYPQQILERKKAEVLQKGITLYDFGVGDPREAVPDFIPKALKEAVSGHFGYPSIVGDPLFRQTVADYVKRRFGVELDPERQILPCSGSKEAVFHAPLLVIDPKAPDRTVLFPDPGYPAYCRGALFAGGEAIPVPLTGDFVFRPWELSEEILKKTRLLWLNTPHNPSGAVTSLSDLKRIAALCRKYDILCISDECYADVYTDDPPHSMLECGFENILVFHSLSKRSGMTGYRSAFIAGDPEIIEQYRRLRTNFGVAPQSFVNAAAVAAWSDDSHASARREIFREKKRLFIDFFTEQGWEFTGADASLYLWLKTPEGQSPVEMSEELLSVGVVVSPGCYYALTDAGDQHIRLAMVPDLESCKEAIAQWAALLEKK